MLINSPYGLSPLIKLCLLISILRIKKKIIKNGSNLLRNFRHLIDFLDHTSIKHIIKETIPLQTTVHNSLIFSCPSNSSKFLSL